MPKKSSRFRYKANTLPNGVVVRSQQEEKIYKTYTPLGIVKANPDGIPYVMERTYLPDFYLGRHKRTGHECHLECKEHLTMEEARKYKHVLLSNPTLRLYFIIQSAPDSVFKYLAKLPRCYVVCASFLLPQTWLDAIEPPGIDKTSYDVAAAYELQTNPQKPEDIGRFEL